MTVLTSSIDPRSPAFAANETAMLSVLREVRRLEEQVRMTSNAKKADFAKRGKLLPRERVDLLLDRGSPFLELSTLAGLGMHDDDGVKNVLGAAVILGIGFVCGTRCLICANDSAIKAGTNMPMGHKKRIRGLEIALKNRLPVIHLVESGGANLLHQALSFVEAGQSYRNQARLSAAGIPQIAVVHGSSTAGGAYLPGLSDYIIMVRGQAKVFLAGPPLLRAATGEIARDEELGGAEMHALVSGVADFMAEDDIDAIRMARNIVRHLHWNDGICDPRHEVRSPRYSPDELCGVVPADSKKQYDVREIIARLVDDSDFDGFKDNYGIHTVCGQAHVAGNACAFIGNNGPIDSNGAAKAAQFIQLMCQAGTPIVYLQNTTGFLVGADAERRGIVKHGSKMIQAVANATVPQITIHMGASYGAGNYAMCGRGFDPRFIFGWPNYRVAVMGGEQAAKVMTIIATDRAERAGGSPDAGKLQAGERKIIQQFEVESTALFATARLWDDGIIDPRDTRKVLAFCLDVCRESAARQPNNLSFGVARM